ncbi:Protein still life, isoforms C/SIF type 2 [Halotydeus destructor]|nr:Protein still life, isoforms C/SIF type 2 [Halotydeus destructor]
MTTRPGSRPTGQSPGAAAAAFQCTGAVRKAGFLSVKKWILRKRHQIELARKRGWKGYWVCLKGTTLLFYPCDSRDGRAIENTPRHLIIIDGAIMQPIPEHPKRDNVFCLSTAFGDAYLFQAPCQVELDNWIGAIHNACGAAFARHRGKTGALHLLQDDISRLDRGIDSEAKLRHAAEIQTTGAIDGETRKVLHEQLRNHDENLEQFHCEQYRLRCYMASLQATELPNPKTLLAHVSKATKVTLNRLGVFTVSSLHAYICARSPSMLTNVISGRGSQRRRGGPFGGQGRPLSRGGSLGSRQGSQQRPGSATGERQLTLLLPPDHLTPYSVTVRGTETVEEILWSALGDKQLQPNDYFLRLRTVQENCEPYVPLRHETLDQFPEFEAIEVQAKVLYQVELTRMALDQLFGFSVEAELVENMADVHNQDELCVYVSRAEDMSLAGQQGLMKGDEILVINGAVVSDLDMMYIESVLQEEQSLCMVLRSCRTEPPELAIAVKSTDEYIESLVCPPPPSDGIISDEALDRLIVPSPWDSRAAVTRPSSALGQPGGYGAPATPLGTSVSGEQIAETLLKTAEQVTTEYCRLSAHTSSNQPPGAPSSASKGHPGHHGHSAAAKGGPSAAQPGLPGAGLLNHSNSALPGAAILSHPHHHHPQPQPQLLHQVSVHDEDNLCYIKRPPLSDAEKLRKVIRELLDTERTYVEHLNSLLEIYLEPMKQQNFLNTSDTQTLFGNIVEIVGFQRKFLASLELSVELEGSDFDRLEQCGQFKAILFALGNAFQGHAERFKLYSSFCASHSKAQKILHPSNLDSLNPALTEFLSVRSRGQHAYSLESYLIKPIQRILKYPLLLQQMKHLTAPASEEHRHLSQALKGMERVAEHINEMQRIHEEYGAIFDHLQRQHYKATRVLVELSPVELLYYGGIDWVNMAEFLGKIKKGLDLHAMCFVFKMAVVFLCKERIRQKKKLVGVTSKLSEVEIIRYQVLIPVTEVQVRASRDSSSSATSGSQSSATNGEVVTSGPSPAVPAATSGSSSSQFIWELIHLRCTQISGGSQRRTEKVYQLSNSTNDFRNSFLKTIRQTIRESVRNMAVPFTKPPSLSGRSTPCQTIARSGDITTTSASGTSGPISSTTTTTSTSVTAPSAGSSKQNESITQSTGAKVSGASSSSQASSTSGQTTATEKPAKQKPPPPPRAPTTTKTTSGPSQLPLPPPPCSQPSSPGGASDSSSHSHHGVSCGLCGADVGSTAATSEPGCSGPPQPAKSSMRSSSTGRPEPETSSESGSVAPVAGPSKGRVSALKKSSQSKEVSFDDDWNP